VALQEVDGPAAGSSDEHPLHHLAEILGMTAIAGPTMDRAGADYGNAVLSKRPPMTIRRHDLTVGRHEPRGAIEVVLDTPGGDTRVIATHFGLWPGERHRQATRLAAIVTDPPDECSTTIVAGDLNIWWRGARAMRRLTRVVGSASSIRTFPSRRPLVALDRIVVHPPCRRIAAGVATDDEARSASDHLPLWVDVRPGARRT
jgi:endonuclease/exonuclease/phosphatase family metal-dependent hydrolase